MRRFKQRITHFLKFSAVGASGVFLNVCIFAVISQKIPADIASGVTFLICGQYAFFGHAFLTWGDARERLLRAAWVLFIFGNIGSAAINFAAFNVLNRFGLWGPVVYLIALSVSVPFNYTWDAVVVFPTKTMPEQIIKATWRRLVDRNKHN